MKQPKLSDLTIDRKGTAAMHSLAASSKKIKITINIDQDILEVLRKTAGKSGASYQKLLNQVLRQGLQKHVDAESRLEQLEQEVAKLKKKIAA